jgi:ketosteroid isomerase-like protein
MSQENIELVQSAFDAWNRGEFEAFANQVAEDVAWLEVSGRPEGEPSERLGRDRLQQSLESLFEAWESYRLEIASWSSSGRSPGDGQAAWRSTAGGAT